MTGTTTYSYETTPLSLTPPQRISDVGQRGRSKLLRNTITLASQVYGTSGNIVLGSLPNGARIENIKMITDTSLGSSTISIGNSSSATAYSAATTMTATDTWTQLASVAALAAEQVSVDTPLLANILVANLPASGTLIIDVEYVEW